jgi:hypothetical protein
MHKRDVPQDGALFGGLKELCYALDENGAYVLVESAGWEPANVANLQAWEVIESEIAGVLEKVRVGESSPLAYHMARHQMSPGLLARYAGLFTWQVRRHMRPGPFCRMRGATRKRYSAVFRIPEAQLTTVPVETASQ